MLHRSAWHDTLTHRTRVPDYLRDRPLPIRDTLQQQHSLGDACAPFVVQITGWDFTALALALALARNKKIHPPHTSPFSHAETQFFVARSQSTIMNDLHKKGLGHFPGILEAHVYDSPYCVDMSVGTCTCRNFCLTNLPCKHIFGVLKNTSQPFSSLPPALLNNPWLNIDWKVSWLWSFCCVFGGGGISRCAMSMLSLCLFLCKKMKLSLWLFSCMLFSVF